MKRERRAGGLGLALQREHEAVAVEDAGRGRVQRADAGQRRLQRSRLARPTAARDRRRRWRRPVRASASRPATSPWSAATISLPQRAMRDAVRLAEIVEQRPPAHAEPRLEAAGGIIDAGMDHLAVARRGLLAEAGRAPRRRRPSGPAAPARARRRGRSRPAPTTSASASFMAPPASVVSRAFGSIPQPRSSST